MKRITNENELDQVIEQLLRGALDVELEGFEAWLVKNREQIDEVFRWSEWLPSKDDYVLLRFLNDGYHPFRDYRSLTDLAREIGVNQSSINNWKRRYPDFPRSVFNYWGDQLYDIELVRRFVTERGLTGKAKSPRSETGALEEAWKKLPKDFSVAEGCLLMLSAARMARKANGNRRQSSGLFSVVDQLPRQIRGKLQLGTKKHREAAKGWHKAHWPLTADHASFQQVLDFVRVKMREGKIENPGSGSPSLGILIRSLLPHVTRVVDVTPSAGYLLDAFEDARIPQVAVCPAAELAAIASAATLGDLRQVVVADWSKRPLLGLDVENSVVIGVAPTRPPLAMARPPATPTGPRRRKRGEASDPVDDFIKSVVEALPARGVGAIVVPTRWCTSPTNKEYRKDLMDGNLLEKVIHLVANLVPGGAKSTLLVLRKGRPVDGEKSCIILSDFNLEGVKTKGGKRLRDLTEDECENQRDLALSEPTDTPDRHPMRDEATPFRLGIGAASKQGFVLVESAYYGPPNRIALDFDSSIDGEIEDARSALKELREESESLLSDFGKATHLVGRLRDSNRVDLAEKVEITFIQRKKGREWTANELQPNDIAVSLLGLDAGASCTGHKEANEHPTRFARIARLRIREDHQGQIDQRYLREWAACIGPKLPTSGAHIVKRIGRSVIQELKVPLPGLEVQGEFADRMNQIRHALEGIEKYHQIIKDIRSLLLDESFSSGGSAEGEVDTPISAAPSK